jgi:porin
LAGECPCPEQNNTIAIAAFLSRSSRSETMHTVLRSVLASASIAATVGAASAQQAADHSPEQAQLYRDYQKSHPYLYDEFSAGEAGTSGIDDLDEIDRPEISIADTARFDSPLGFVRSKFDALYDKTGLRLGVAFTALGMWASGAGDPNGAAGDLDLLSAWTLVGRGSPNTGVLVATAEYRSEITDQPPSALGAELGTLINVTNGFNDRGWVVRDFYWLQRLYQGKLRFLVGRADMGDFVGTQPMQNVNTMFVNRHFSGNPTVPSPGHGPTIGFSVRPDDSFYVTAGMANAYNSTTESELSSIDYGDFFYSVEAGFTPYVEGRGRGRYSIMGWYIDERTRDTLIPSDQGLTLVAGQQLSDRFQVWARYCYADATTTNVRQLAQGGVGYSGLLGSPSNLTGLAVSYAQPRSAASRDESVVEVFQRVQASRFIQLSAGAQAIFDPGNNPADDLIGVFYARLRIAF